MYQFRTLVKDKHPKTVQNAQGQEVIVYERVTQYRKIDKGSGYCSIIKDWTDFEEVRESEL